MKNIRNQTIYQMLYRLVDQFDKLFVVSMMLNFLAYCLWRLSTNDNEVMVVGIGDVLSVLPILLSLCLCWIVVFQRSLHIALRRAWLFIALGVTIYTLEEMYDIFVALQLLQALPFPSSIDAFFLMFYPTTFIGLLLFPFHRPYKAEWITFWLDTAMITFVMVLVIWHTNIQPFIPLIQQDTMEAIILAYPVGDSIILFAVMSALLRQPKYDIYAPLVIMLFAYVIVSITNIVSVNQVYRGTYEPIAVTDIAWTTFNLLISVSAWLQIKQRHEWISTPRLRRNLFFQLLPYGAVFFLYGLTFYIIIEKWQSSLNSFLIGTGITTLLVIVRQIVVIIDNDRLRKALEASNHQLQQLALTDALTGTANRRALDARMEEEIQRTRRYEEPLALIMLDIDNFKQYNDTYGHPAGDELLQHVGTLLRDHMRPTDMIARYGGEEFALLLANTDSDDAWLMAERLRVLIETESQSIHWARRPLTASFGVAYVQGKTASGIELQEQADAALYRAKRTRNAVILATQHEP